MRYMAGKRENCRIAAQKQRKIVNPPMLLQMLASVCILIRPRELCGLITKRLIVQVSIGTVIEKFSPDTHTFSSSVTEDTDFTLSNDGVLVRIRSEAVLEKLGVQQVPAM